MIKIEVTGGSITEVADKLLAIGTSLRNGRKVWWEETDAPQKLKAAMDAQLAEELEVAEQAPSPLPPSDGPTEASPSTEPKAFASLPTEASDAPPETSQSTSTPPTESISTASGTLPDNSKTMSTPPASASELNFDTDVAPYVLQVVKEKGKPVAQEILSQFGVEKASSLDPAQWPELVATLKGAL